MANKKYYNISLSVINVLKGNVKPVKLMGSSNVQKFQSDMSISFKIYYCVNTK